MSAPRSGTAGPGDYQTPPELWTPINEHYRFTYDAFASHENALCDRYSTPEGTFRTEGLRDPIEISDEDAFTRSWAGERVWVQPPFSRGFTPRVVEKMIEEWDEAELIVALLIADTSTKAFHRLMPVSFIEFIPHRVRFLDPKTGKPAGPAPHGHMLVEMRIPWQ